MVLYLSTKNERHTLKILPSSLFCFNCKQSYKRKFSRPKWDHFTIGKYTDLTSLISTHTPFKRHNSLGEKWPNVRPSACRLMHKVLMAAHHVVTSHWHLLRRVPFLPTLISHSLTANTLPCCQICWLIAHCLVDRSPAGEGSSLVFQGRWGLADGKAVQVSHLSFILCSQNCSQNCSLLSDLMLFGSA